MASSGHDFELKTEGFVVADTGDEVTLPCHLSPNISAVSMTIRWFKETKCIYVYKNGQVKKGRGYEDRLSLVTQELKRGNVSLTLRDFRGSDRGVYICQVIHGEQEQETAVGLWNTIGLDQLVDRALQYLKKETAEKKLERIRSAELLEMEMNKKKKEEQQEEIKKKDLILENATKEMNKKDLLLKNTTKEMERKDLLRENNIREMEKKDLLLENTTREMGKTRGELETLKKDLQDKTNQADTFRVQLEHKDKEIEEKNSVLKERDKLLEERNKHLHNQDEQLQVKDRELTEMKQEVEEKNRQLEEEEKILQERDEELQSLRTTLQEQNNQLEILTVQLEERDSRIEDMSQHEEELQQQLEEKDKLLKERNKMLTETEDLLTEHKRRLEEVNHENTHLAQSLCDLKTESESLKNELLFRSTDRADVSDTGLAVQIRRRRRSKEEPPLMGAESLDPESTLPLRRRRSIERNTSAMGAESSTPDSPVSPRVSELRLVLLGRTEAGRSAVGNTILDREEFGAQASPSAESQRSRRREGDVCGRRLVLVDTPDWFSPGLPLEEMRQDAGLCVRLSAPGPHAFLLVIPVEASEEKEEERGMMERMEEVFGEGCWGHTVILFTHADSLTQQSIEEFLRAGSPDLKKLVEKCGNRHHVLNIKDRAQGTQVSELLDQIEEMVSGNTESFYSTQIYREAETQVREMKGVKHREIEEKKQREEREIQEIFKKQQDCLKKKEIVIQELKENVDRLTNKIKALEKELEKEKDSKNKEELERKLKLEISRRKEREREIEVYSKKFEKEKRQLKEKYSQEITKVRERSEEEARVEAERNLMKVVLPALQKNLQIYKSERDLMFDRQLAVKDREIETLRQQNKHLSDAQIMLEDTQFRETRVQRLPLGVLGWFRRNPSSWILVLGIVVFSAAFQHFFL